MKTAVATSTEQIIVPTQSSAFSQEPIQDANSPFGLFLVGGLLIGGLGLVIAATIGGLVFAIAATNFTKRRRRRLVHQSLGRTHNVGSSNHHSRPHSNSYRHSNWNSDSDSSYIFYDSSGSGSSDNSSSCSSYDSSPTSWSSDNSNCSSYDSSPTSWSSDSSSSCTSHDSSSSSSFGGGSSDCGGAGSNW